ncbi:MAG: RDD family protein [Actinomycetota bacterium]
MPERREPRPREPGSEPLPGRVLGTGARGVRRVAELTGVDRAIEVGAEEAIVRAAESPAVERAFARILAGPAVEEAVARAVQSPAVERAILEVLDSEMLDHVWDRLLDSDEAQRLVERIAEAPEVRAAIAAQGVGLLGDLGRQVGRATRGFDDVIERVVRSVLRRPARTERSQAAGLATRFVALVVDAGILNAGFFVVAAIVAFLISGLSGGTDQVSGQAIVAGGTAWLVAGSLYLLTFWSSVGQTPGMRFVHIHLEADGEPRIGRRLAVRRIYGVALCVLTLGLGFLGVLFSERRRGLHDRVAGTDVVYDVVGRRAQT